MSLMRAIDYPSELQLPSYNERTVLTDWGGTGNGTQDNGGDENYQAYNGAPVEDGMYLMVLLILAYGLLRLLRQAQQPGGLWQYKKVPLLANMLNASGRMSGLPLNRGWPAGGRSGVFTLPFEKLSEARERAKPAIEQVLFGLKSFFWFVFL
jgi:hypothetical protein